MVMGVKNAKVGDECNDGVTGSVVGPGVDVSGKS